MPSGTSRDWRIIAIDPGPVESAWICYEANNGIPLAWRKAPNAQVLAEVPDLPVDQLAIEMIASYGMAVGAEVFETCVWIGRFIQGWAEVTGAEPLRILRRDVKLHLCGSARAKDPNVRQALIDRWGGKEAAIGRKASPGPLYGVSGDVWAALAVAVCVADTRLEAAA